MKLFFLIFYSLYINFALAQPTKNEWKIFRKLPDSIKIDGFSKGEYQAYIPNQKIETFINNLLYHGLNYQNKEYGHIKLEKIYSDSVYTVFVNRYSTYYYPYFKVLTNDLSMLNWHSLNGDQIRKQFINEVIPLADKKKTAEKQDYCKSDFDNSYFIFNYRKETRTIDVFYKWHIDCGYMKAVNKKYRAIYNVSTKTFSNQ